jgi:hypothetical protein
MKLSWKTSLLGGLVAANLLACGEEPKPTPDEKPVGQRIEVTEKITTDTTWKAENVYVLKGHVFVESGTLKIEAGTRIEGEGLSSLVVTTGGRIDAVGTQDKPIVFTSTKAEGTRAPADWGGVVLLGKAPINVQGGTTLIEGFPATQPGITYGGTDEAHDCGKLKYVRIEFAGFKLTANNELNGLTLGGCGNKTEVDYLQVHKGADDGVEMFGGTANLKHIVVTQPDDDGLDWDIGYRGKVQFLIVQQNPDVGNFAFEGDNSPNNPGVATPVSTPEIWNATLIGSNQEPGKAGKLQGGMHLKNGTAGTLRNIIVANFTDIAVDIDGTPTVARLSDTANTLSLQNILYWDNKNVSDTVPHAPQVVKDASGNVTDPDKTKYDEGALAASGNRALVNNDPKLTGALNLLAPDFKPQAGSPALVSDYAAVPESKGFFDTNARFIGAIGTEDWTKGWTAFPRD